MKKCTHCKQIKNEADFSINSRRPDKLQCWCKECKRENKEKNYYSNLEETRKENNKKQRELRKKNIERHREYGRKRYLKDREKILARRVIYWEKNRAKINKQQVIHSRERGVKPKPGYIYIARFPHLIEGKTIYKIGQSSSPFSRIDRISSFAPVPLVLEILIKTDDMSMLESDLHNHFWKNNSNKEWFFLNKNDYEHITKKYKCLFPPFSA